MADGAALALLTTCGDSGEAGALRSRLEAEGIPSVIQGEQHHAMLGTIYGSVIEPRVLVPEAALERARALLVAWEKGEPGEEEVGGADEGEAKEAGQPRCADHGSPPIGTCTRCGAFVCEACVGGAKADFLCPACEARASEEEAPRRRNTRRLLAVLVLALLGVPVLLGLALQGFRTLMGR